MGLSAGRLGVSPDNTTGQADRQPALRIARPCQREYNNRDGAEFNVGETFAGLSYELGVDLSEEVTALAPAGMTTWPVSTPTRCKITSAGHTEQSKRDDRTTSGLRMARG